MLHNSSPSSPKPPARQAGLLLPVQVESLETANRARANLRGVKSRGVVYEMTTSQERQEQGQDGLAVVLATLIVLL